MTKEVLFERQPFYQNSFNKTILTFASAALRNRPQMTNMINKFTSLKAILERLANGFEGEREDEKLNFCFTIRRISKV